MKRYTQALTCIAAAAVLTAPAAANAAPVVRRLTPPSAGFSGGPPNAAITARFMPGQRFDLQATIDPDAGRTITGAHFLLDGAVIPNSVTWSVANTNNVPAGSVVASVRAFSVATPGVHTFGITAIQSDNQLVTATGYFEVVDVRETGLAAKKVIIMIGDGMGLAHRTAGRIMGRGVTFGKANGGLSMDYFPVTGIVTTHSLNSICTDSSPGASCYATGNKANNNQHGVFPDDTMDNGDNPRIESIGEYLHRVQGRALGLVTTTDVFDSTPAAFGSHTQARSAGTGICDEFFDARNATGLKVLMGGGRKWFLPFGVPGSGRTAGTDYATPPAVASAWGVPAGVLDPSRDLLNDFILDGFTYVPTATALNAVPAYTKKLLGLFQLSNMNVAKDKIDKRRLVAAGSSATSVVDDYGFPDQPMLDEMTASALKVLDQYNDGFVLMVEGGSIDKQAHLMDSERWMIDVLEFDRAIDLCQRYAEEHPDTLVIVTADHECAGAHVIGGSRLRKADLQARANGGGVTGLRNQVVGTLELAGFPNYVIANDGYPLDTDIDFKMIVGYACNADRYEDWITNLLPLQNASHGIATIPPLPGYPQNPMQRDVAGNFFVVGQIPDQIATHTASDIVLSAAGRGAGLFTGVMDNTEVFFRVMRVAFGDNRQGQIMRNSQPGNGQKQGAFDKILDRNEEE